MVCKFVGYGMMYGLYGMYAYYYDGYGIFPI